jgi:hypothetical protein
MTIYLFAKTPLGGVLSEINKFHNKQNNDLHS